MNIVVVGHVDHGKSTVVGRLMADTGSLPDGKLEQVRSICARHSKPFEYAFLLDALKEERAQGITIDAARVFFKTPKRDYILIDAPGHVEFIKNMVTGASRAEAALLVIDANEGVQENTRRHGYLLGMLAIRQIVVLVNKMDLVGYSQEVFNRIQSEYGAFLKEIGCSPSRFIPVSGFQGDNIAAVSSHMPWHQGETVLQTLDAFCKEPPVRDQSFRMPVQGVYKFTRFGDDRRIIAGMVESGKLNAGDTVIFYPSGKKSKVRAIETFPVSQATEVTAGMAAGFTLEEQIFISRGEVATRADEPKPEISTRIQARIFWMGKEPLLKGKNYWLKTGAAKTSVALESILRVVHAASLETEPGKDRVKRHEAAEVVLKTQKAIAFDLVAAHLATGRFVLVDGYEIAGGGIIQRNVDDPQKKLREQVELRETKWIPSEIEPAERAARHQQEPALVLITGEFDAPRKALARLLENRLYQAGFETYYLGFGSIRHGLDADLKDDEKAVLGNEPGAQEDFLPQELTGIHREHIRRFGEIANILLHAGLIMISTAAAFTEEDLNILRTMIPSSKILTLWLGNAVTTDLTCEMKLDPAQDSETHTTRIAEELCRRGILKKNPPFISTKSKKKS